MAQAMNRFEGGNLVVQSLKTLGVRQIFSVSGGPLNSIYNACAAHDLPLHHTRHEAGACFMAEAVSRLTGVPGVAAVTLGPGVTNTVTAALVSKMAGTPLLIIGAQANTRAFDRGAGMSADHIPIMTPVTKWAARVLSTERIPEYIEAAWRHMWSGTPGPVFLEIPANILSAPAVETPIRSFERRWPGLSVTEAGKLIEVMARVERPLLLIGDEVRWDQPAGLSALVERMHLPFATLRLARGMIDETGPLCIGPGYVPCNETLRRAFKEADLVILLGHHFEFDLSFGDTLGANTQVMQCVANAELLGRNRRADFGILASPSAFVTALVGAKAPQIDRSWVDGLAAEWRREREAQLKRSAGEELPLHPVAAIDAVASAVPGGTAFVTSHGNVDFWADARLQMKQPNLYLRAGQSGALGAELPYAVGARFADPTRPVVVFVGDGGIGYHATELETAARYDRPVIVVVLDDQKWGAIALPQRMSYGGEFEMDLPRRDWVKVAEGLGGFGVHANTVNEIRDGMARALKSRKPSVVQIPVLSVISPYMAFISK